jgi:hypothetical protein
MNELDPNLAPLLNPTDEQVYEARSNVRHTVLDLQAPWGHCDFCCIPGSTVSWRYPTKGVETLAGPLRLVDPTPWSACADCAALIEAGQYLALVERHLDANNPDHERAFRARALQALYTAFAKARGDLARVAVTT